jgi:hypothetical protein
VRLEIDLRGMERVLLLVTELEHLQRMALERAEHETADALGRMLVRFCADTDEDRATLGPPAMAELEFRAEQTED